MDDIFVAWFRTNVPGKPLRDHHRSWTSMVRRWIKRAGFCSERACTPSDMVG
jgi:hypothetical protein